MEQLHHHFSGGGGGEPKNMAALRDLGLFGSRAILPLAFPTGMSTWESLSRTWQESPASPSWKHSFHLFNWKLFRPCAASSKFATISAIVGERESRCGRCGLCLRQPRATRTTLSRTSLLCRLYGDGSICTLRSRRGADRDPDHRNEWPSVVSSSLAVWRA